MVRPKKGSEVKFLMKGDDKIKEGKVINVGKRNSIKRNTVWLHGEDNVTKEIDFRKDIKSWKNIKEERVKFNISEIELDKKREKNREYHHDKVEQEAFRVFLMTRKEPFEV